MEKVLKGGLLSNWSMSFRNPDQLRLLSPSPHDIAETLDLADPPAGARIAGDRMLPDHDRPYHLPRPAPCGVMCMAFVSAFR